MSNSLVSIHRLYRPNSIAFSQMRNTDHIWFGKERWDCTHSYNWGQKLQAESSDLHEFRKTCSIKLNKSRLPWNTVSDFLFRLIIVSFTCHLCSTEAQSISWFYAIYSVISFHTSSRLKHKYFLQSSIWSSGQGQKKQENT